MLYVIFTTLLVNFKINTTCCSIRVSCSPSSVEETIDKMQFVLFIAVAVTGVVFTQVGYSIIPSCTYDKWASTQESCLCGFANNKGANQPAHPRSLVSVFVIRFLKSIISKLATSEISVFLLVSVAEETALSPALSETLKSGFLASRPKWSSLLSGRITSVIIRFIR